MEARFDAKVTLNDVVASSRVVPQVFVVVDAIVVVPETAVMSPASIGSPAGQKTGSEKVSVSVGVPAVPVAETSVGLVVSPAVELVVFVRGDVVPLPAASLIFAPPCVSRVSEMNEPVVTGAVRKTLALVTALLKVELQVGMLSPVTVLAVAVTTADQSPAAKAPVVAVRQTASLKVAVAIEPATVTEV